MSKNFTRSATQAIELAQHESSRGGHIIVGTGALLLGLLQTGASVAATTLKSLGVDLVNARIEVANIVRSNRQILPPPGYVPDSMLYEYVLNRWAEVEADKRGDGFIGTEHLLLAMLNEPQCVAMQLLAVGVSPEDLRGKIEGMLDVGDFPPNLYLTEAALTVLVNLQTIFAKDNPSDAIIAAFERLQRT